MNVRVALILFGLLMSGCRSAPPPAPPEPVLDLTIRSAELDGNELLAALDDVSRVADEQRPGALAALCRLVQHPDSLVRIRAVKSLSEVPYRSTPEAYAAFLQALEDSHWLVRGFAARGLGLANRGEAIAVLEQKIKTEPHEKVRKRMEEALKKLHPPVS